MTRIATAADIPALLAMLDAMGQRHSEESLAEWLTSPDRIVAVRDDAQGQPDALLMTWRYSPTEVTSGPLAVRTTGIPPGQRARATLQGLRAVAIETDDERARRGWPDTLMVWVQIWPSSDAFRKLFRQALGNMAVETGPDGSWVFRRTWGEIMAALR